MIIDDNNYRNHLNPIVSGGKLPWIAISTGKTGTSQALPGTVDETLKLLGRFK